MKFFFRTMNIIYSSFIISSILMVGVSIYLSNSKLEIQVTLSQVKIWILIIFILISIILSRYIYKKNLERINENDQLILKLQAYQSAFIYRLSILEFTLIISILFFIFSKLWIILIFSLIVLFLIISSRPSKKNFLKIFSISETELKSLG